MLRDALSGVNHFQAAGEPSDDYLTVKPFMSSARVADQSFEMIDHVVIHIHIHAFLLECACKLRLQQVVMTLQGVNINLLMESSRGSSSRGVTGQGWI